MIAKVTIYDDNGNPKGTYELKPSRIYKNDISTKYIFDFEYAQLNHRNKYMKESEDKEYQTEVVTAGNCMICGKELDEGLFICKECEARAEKVRNEYESGRIKIC